MPHVQDDKATLVGLGRRSTVLKTRLFHPEILGVPFYDEARSTNTALAIATGEQRVYANLLLTIGVVPPE